MIWKLMFDDISTYKKLLNLQADYFNFTRYHILLHFIFELLCLPEYCFWFLM